MVVVVDVNNLKNGRKPVKLQRKVQQDALGKVNKVKEIRRRGEDGLKINRQQHYVRKKVSRASKCEVKARVCEVSLGRREEVVMERVGGE